MLLRRSPTSTSARKRLRRGRERACAQARELEPQDLGTLFQLGAVLERQKRTTRPRASSARRCRSSRTSAPVLNYLGYMNADRGVRVEEAVALIEKAVALDPENGAYLDSLGWALFRLDRLDAGRGVPAPRGREGSRQRGRPRPPRRRPRQARGRVGKRSALAAGAQGRGRGRRARPGARGARRSARPRRGAASPAAERPRRRTRPSSPRAAAADRPAAAACATARPPRTGRRRRRPAAAAPTAASCACRLRGRELRGRARVARSPSSGPTRCASRCPAPAGCA